MARRCDRPKARHGPHDHSAILIHLAWVIRHSAFMSQTPQSQRLSFPDFLTQSQSHSTHCTHYVAAVQPCFGLSAWNSFGSIEVDDSQRNDHPIVPDPAAHFPTHSQGVKACQPGEIQANQTNRLTPYATQPTRPKTCFSHVWARFSVVAPLFSQSPTPPPCQQRLPLWILARFSRKGLSPTSNHLRPQLPFKAPILPSEGLVLWHRYVRTERVTSVPL